MKAVGHLTKLQEFDASEDELTEQSNEKVSSTIKYSMQQYTMQKQEHVRTRCVVATLGEQKVAEHMEGVVMHNPINYDDPYSFGFDVLSSPTYYGARVEVKTTMSPNKWININTEHKSVKGHLNVFHFLEFPVADYITIFRVKEVGMKFKFTREFTGNRHEFKRILRRSRYTNNWYLNLK